MMPPDAPEPTTAPAAAPGVLPSSWPLGAWIVSAALAAGLIGWLAGEANYQRFKPVVVRPPNWNEINPYARSDILSRQILAQRPPSEAMNTALAYGVLGAALGLGLGLAGSLARGDVRAGLSAGLVGLLLGGAAGAGLAAALVLGVYYPNITPESGLLLPFLAHGGPGGGIGAAAGLAFGLGLGGGRLAIRGLLGGLVGALIGTLAFEVLNGSGMVFPLPRVEAPPIPEDRPARLAGHLLVAIGTALGAWLGATERSRVPAATRRPTPA
jgi:hypothetical protein